MFNSSYGLSIRIIHFLFDLLGYVKNQIYKLNIHSVSSEMAFDTYSDERFFSCRRAAKKGEPSFGGHFSCIFME